MNGSKILWYIVSCFHPESWISLTGCTWKAYRNCFDAKNWRNMVFSCVLWFMHLRRARKPFETNTSHVSTAQLHFMFSTCEPWPERHAKIPSPKKIHLNILVTSEFSCEVSIVLHMKKKKHQISEKIHPSPRRICVPLYTSFQQNPFDLGLFRICHVNLEEGIFRPRWNRNQPDETCTVHQSHQS